MVFHAKELIFVHLHFIMTTSKTATARLSILSNTLLILLKFTAGIISGSVSIISEAIHSLMDLLAAVIAYFSVKVSGKPADPRHPVGHGKFENISGVAEAILIFIAAIWIIAEAAHKLFSPAVVEFPAIGIAVMGISAVVNILVSRKLYRVARETDSIALEADALHLKTDVYTSAGVAAGLALIWLTGYHFLDPVIAILVALLILKESYFLFRRAYDPLLDTALPEAEISQVEEIIRKHTSGGLKFHNLRTRKSGPFRYIDFHLEVPGNMTVKTSHELCDLLEREIMMVLGPAEVNIHVETV